MWKIAIISAILSTFVIIHQVQTCNEAVCGSIVSKCLLTQSCKCDLKNCTCCKDCFNCLSYLYDECCSCVDMCPKQHDINEINESLLSKKSNVEEFSESVPGLFNVLTEYPDPQMRWNSTTFPINIDASQQGTKQEIKIHMLSAEQETAPIKPNVFTVNCTVAFLSGCMNYNKCRGSCQTMGASSFRWFHDGCCECVGSTCINYGINESRCRNCSHKASEELEEDLLENEEDYDYGQDNDLD